MNIFEEKIYYNFQKYHLLQTILRKYFKKYNFRPKTEKEAFKFQNEA